MVEKDEVEDSKEERSPLIFKEQTHAELRRLAKKNLENADRVLAESGHQLLKNKVTDPDTCEPDRAES